MGVPATRGGLKSRERVNGRRRGPAGAPALPVGNRRNTRSNRARLTLPGLSDKLPASNVPVGTESPMKVICDRGALLNAVNLISGVVAARTPRPQLQCVKLTAKKNGKASELTMSAADAEISLKLRTAQVDVQDAGEALIPADKLRGIVAAEEGDATLTIEAEQDAIHIRGTDAHFKVF